MRGGSLSPRVNMVVKTQHLFATIVSLRYGHLGHFFEQMLSLVQTYVILLGAKMTRNQPLRF